MSRPLASNLATAAIRIFPGEDFNRPLSAVIKMDVAAEAMVRILFNV